MQAETLHCPACGAAAASDATRCEFCAARLKTVACPRCFAMMFVGTKHCSSCGAKADAASSVESAAGRTLSCPRCRAGLEAIAVGSARLKECARCDGLWVDVESFERIVSEREEQSAVLGAPTLLQKAGGAGASGQVRYVPCPECGELMNRVNFARCSGVVVDVCKGHGTWFDRDELRQIVEFIQGGGLSVSREREKQEVEAERRKLKQEQLSASLQNRRLGSTFEPEDRRWGAVSAAGELLSVLLDR
ncbi:MAG TPA: zf-TFIIB domain-containing protein [Pyrinomonadaceae bacterium]|nr:zf-TFIIB domain-containing protein [Pyrinomonadaceae bacterium]